MSSIAHKPTTQNANTSAMLLLAMSAPEEIGRRMRAARVRKGWTQLDFAIAAHVSPSTVTRWERGLLPRVKELMRVAELLEVPVEELVEPAPDADDLGTLAAIRERLSRLEATEAQNAEMLAELLRLARGDPDSTQSAASDD